MCRTYEDALQSKYTLSLDHAFLLQLKFHPCNMSCHQIDTPIAPGFYYSLSSLGGALSFELADSFSVSLALVCPLLLESLHALLQASHFVSM